MAQDLKNPIETLKKMLPEKFGKIFSQNFSQIVSNSMKDNGKALEEVQKSLLLLLPPDILDKFQETFLFWKMENLPQEKVPESKAKALDDILENLTMLINLSRIFAHEVIDLIFKIRKSVKVKATRMELAKSASKVYGLSLFLKMSWTFYEQFSQITDDKDLEDPPDLKHVDLVIKSMFRDELATFTNAISSQLGHDTNDRDTEDTPDDTSDALQSQYNLLAEVQATLERGGSIPASKSSTSIEHALPTLSLGGHDKAEHLIEDVEAILDSGICKGQLPTSKSFTDSGICSSEVMSAASSELNMSMGRRHEKVEKVSFDL